VISIDEAIVMDDIAILRSEVAALTAKLSALEARLPPPEKQVTVADLAIVGQTYANRPLQPRSNFVMPTDKELSQLCARVRRRWPVLNNLQGLINDSDPIAASWRKHTKRWADIRSA
jgi:hypothetical protein